EQEVRLAATRAMEELAQSGRYLQGERRDAWRKTVAEMTPPLCQASQSMDAKTRQAAARALGSMVPAAEAVVPALTPLLGDAVAAVRVEAASSLRYFAAEARPAAARLLRALRDDDAAVRAAAAFALIAIAPPGRETVA